MHALCAPQRDDKLKRGIHSRAEDKNTDTGDSSCFSKTQSPNQAPGGFGTGAKEKEKKNYIVRPTYFGLWPLSGHQHRHRVNMKERLKIGSINIKAYKPDMDMCEVFFHKVPL